METNQSCLPVKQELLCPYRKVKFGVEIIVGGLTMQKSVFKKCIKEHFPKYTKNGIEHISLPTFLDVILPRSYSF